MGVQSHSDILIGGDFIHRKYCPDSDKYVRTDIIWKNNQNMVKNMIQIKNKYFKIVWIEEKKCVNFYKILKYKLIQKKNIQYDI